MSTLYRNCQLDVYVLLGSFHCRAFLEEVLVLFVFIFLLILVHSDCLSCEISRVPIVSLYRPVPDPSREFTNISLIFKMSSFRSRDCSLLYRQFLPIFLGLCIGITFSIVLSSTEENGCQKNSFHHFSDIIDQNNQPVDLIRADDTKNVQENNEDLSDYEPRINLAGKPHTAKKEPQSLIRPRYFSTELGIKDKSFVAVLSSVNQIATLGVAVNKTLADQVNHMAFFVEIAENEKLDVKTLPIVGFKDNQQGLLTLHTLKYLAEKLADTYSFFFLMKDTTYANGKKLVNLMNHISISEDIYMGSTTSDLTTSPSICLIGQVITEYCQTKIL